MYFLFIYGYQYIESFYSSFTVIFKPPVLIWSLISKTECTGVKFRLRRLIRFLVNKPYIPLLLGRSIRSYMSGTRPGLLLYSSNNQVIKGRILSIMFIIKCFSICLVYIVLSVCRRQPVWPSGYSDPTSNRMEAHNCL